VWSGSTEAEFKLDLPRANFRIQSFSLDRTRGTARGYLSNVLSPPLAPNYPSPWNQIAHGSLPLPAVSFKISSLHYLRTSLSSCYTFPQWLQKEKCAPGNFKYFLTDSLQVILCSLWPQTQCLTLKVKRISDFLFWFLHLSKLYLYVIWIAKWFYQVLQF
jgi:hypothetical protein